MAMYLWRISQTVNLCYGTYDSAVVAAESEEDARNTHPDPYDNFAICEEWFPVPYGSWCARRDVKVKKIGTADDGIAAGVVVASRRSE